MRKSEGVPKPETHCV